MNWRCALLILAWPAMAMQPDSLAEKSERAKLWMAQGRFPEAALLYEELVKAVPGNPGLLMNLGMARHMAGDDARAIPALEAAIRIQPLPPALLMLGASYMRSGQPAKALPPLERYLAGDPAHREARQMAADAAMMTGNHRSAVTHLTKLVEVEPSRPRLWYDLGHAQAAAGQRDRARQAFEKLAALGASAELTRFQAEAARDQGRHTDAVKLWEAALQASPGDASIEAELASSLNQARDFERAREIAARLVEREAESGDWNLLLGGILLNLQQPDQAVAPLQKAVAKAPRSLPARAALGRALVGAGRAPEAIPHLAAALPIDTDASLHFQLARAYQAAGREAEAKAALAKYQAMRAKLDAAR